MQTNRNEAKNEVKNARSTKKKKKKEKWKPVDGERVQVNPSHDSIVCCCCVRVCVML